MKKILYLYLIVFPFTLFGQNKNLKREKGFQFNVQTFAAVVGNKDDASEFPYSEELYMHTRHSRLFGANFEAHYRFDEYWIVGLGTGFEQIKHPDISYIPVYLSLRSSIGGDKIEAPIFRLDVGTQFGDLAKIAPLFRVGMGYRLPIYKEFCLNLEGIITYQGIRKEFDLEPDTIMEYNMFGIGIGAGIEL